jgi:putative peptidoglycan lipid II flippase
MTGLLQIFLSYWSESFAAEPPAIFWKKARRDVRVVFWIMLLISIVLILLRDPITRLVYGHGPVTPAQLKAIASLFGWFMVGFAPTVLNLLYVRVLFVLKKSRVFCVQSWIRWILNIVFNFLFMKWWGLQGIVISTSCVFIVTTVWLHFYLKRYEREGAL